MKKSIVGLALLSSFNVNAALVNGNFDDYTYASTTNLAVTPSACGNCVAQPSDWVQAPSTSSAVSPNLNRQDQYVQIVNDSSAAHSGNYFASLVPFSVDNASFGYSFGFSQTFTSTQTGAATLSWWDRAHLDTSHGVYSTWTYDVVFNDQHLGEFTVSDPDAWMQQSFAVNLLADNTLTFYAGPNPRLASEGFAGNQVSTVFQDGHYSKGAFIDTISVAAVPEPETYAMFLVGLGLLGFAARRRQS